MRRLLWSLLALLPALGIAWAVSPSAGAGTAQAPAPAPVPAKAAAAAFAALKNVSVAPRPGDRVPDHALRVQGAPTQVEYYSWAGYADDHSSGHTYRKVAGDWSQPAITCTTEDQIAVFWVGIDGFNGGKTQEQVGTMAQCFKGKAFYYTWWEMFPAKGIQLVGKTVAPDDKIIGSVSRSGTTYTLKITDSTHTANSFSTAQTCAAATCVDSSAEWIAEAPASARGDYPLPDFRTWTLASASVTSGSKAGTISTFPDDEITMIDSSVTYPLAQPGALNPKGNSFTVTWKNSY